MTTMAQLLDAKTIELAVRHSSFGNTKQTGSDHIRVDATESGVVTDPAMYRVIKNLIDSDELEAIRKFDGETGALCRFYGHSSKLRPGMYVIPEPLIEKVSGIMKARAIERAALVSAAVEVYPQRVAEASAKLGIVHNPADYISQEAFADRFAFTWQWAKVEVPSKLAQSHPELWAEEVEKQAAIRARIALEMKEAAREMMADLVARFRESLKETSDGKRRRFYDTTVTNLQAFLDVFTFKNAAVEDDDLDTIVTEARALITGMDPESFREKGSAAEGYRRTVREELDKLAEQLEPLAQPTRTRRIRVDRPASSAA